MRGNLMYYKLSNKFVKCKYVQFDLLFRSAYTEKHERSCETAHCLTCITHDQLISNQAQIFRRAKNDKNLLSS
jgi:hypothetical protein